MATRKGYVDVIEAARRLGTTKQTVHNRIKAGRYRREEIVTQGGQKKYEIPEEDILPDILPDEPGLEPKASRKASSVRSEVETRKDLRSESTPDQLTSEVSAALASLVEEIGQSNAQMAEALKGQLEAKDRRIAQLEAELEGVRRPWWRRIFG